MEWILDHIVDIYLIVCLLFLAEHPAFDELKHKGYRDDLTAYAKTVAPSMIFILTGTWLSHEAVTYLRNSNVLGAGICGVLSALLALAAFYIPRYIASILNVREARAGPRYVPIYWNVVGCILATLGLFLIGLALFGSDYFEIGDQHSLGLALLGFGGYLVLLYERAKGPNLERALATDFRPPVLYIRSFVQEEHIFLESHNDWPSQGMTFEEYFYHAIVKKLGPFVALGNLTDYAPPQGAVRAYIDVTQWKDRFVELANRASSLLMPQAVSANLKWELEWLKQAGMANKVFLLTPPVVDNGPPDIVKRMLAYIGLKPNNNNSSTKEIPPFDLAQLSEYDLPEGSVIAFTRQGHSELLVHGLKSADEYISIIAHRLEEIGVRQVN